MDNTDQRKAANRAFAQMAETASGQVVLRELRDVTLDIPVFRPAVLGTKEAVVAGREPGPQDETLYAAWREGMNHLYRHILQRIELGKRGE